MAKKQKKLVFLLIWEYNGATNKKDRVVIMARFDQTPEIPAALSVTNRINRFLATPPFVIALMLLTGAANLFSLELAAYTVFCAVAVYTCLFASDHRCSSAAI